MPITLRDYLRQLVSSWGRLEIIIAVIAFGLTIATIVGPLAMLIYGSVRTASPGSPGAGYTLENWRLVYTTGRYVSEILNTVTLSAVVAFLSVAMGSLLAWIVARTDTPFVSRLMPLLVVPMMISNLVTTLAWIALCAPNAGFLNVLIRNTLGPAWILDIYSYAGVIFVLTLHYTSFAFITIFAGFRSIDSSLEEASYMLGAGSLRTAVKMVLPLLAPTLGGAFILIFVFVSENFSVPTILGSSVGLRTLSSAIYVAMANEPSQPSLAAALGSLLVWIAVLGTLWQRRITKSANRYTTISGKPTRHITTALGRWKYLTLGIVVFYIFLSVVLPYLTLIFGSFLKFVTPRITPAIFTLQNYKFLVGDVVRDAFFNSITLGLFGGLFATFFYFVLAYLIRRFPEIGRIVEYLVLIPTAIPALVLGVGLVWLFVGFPIPIYGTAAMLLLAYLVRFVGQGVRHSRNAFIQVSDELPDAARILGAGPIRVMKDVWFPLLKPSVMSLWTLMFLFFFMEIGVTIAVYTSDTVTIPVLLWSRITGGSQTEAFSIALLEASIVFVVLFITGRIFGPLSPKGNG